jgi:hypothetical protein
MKKDINGYIITDKTNTIEWYSQKYDEIYNKADKLFKKYNPCQIKNGICVTGEKCCCGSECIVNSRGKCKYLTEIGCSTKCLLCKLHICGKVKINEVFKNKLMKLYYEALKYNLLLFRSSKEEVMKRFI